MLNNEESRYPSGDKRLPKTSRNENYYPINTPINQDSLLSWESIFSRIGEKPPRRNRTRCPLHNGDSLLSLSVDEKGVFYCHVCHESGDKIHFIRKFYNCGFFEALAWFGLALGKLPKPDPERQRRVNILRDFEAWRRSQARTISLKIYELHQTLQMALARFETDRGDEQAWLGLGVVYPQLSKLEFYAGILSSKEPSELIEAFYTLEGCV